MPRNVTKNTTNKSIFCFLMPFDWYSVSNVWDGLISLERYIVHIRTSLSVIFLPLFYFGFLCLYLPSKTPLPPPPPPPGPEEGQKEGQWRKRQTSLTIFTCLGSLYQSRLAEYLAAQLPSKPENSSHSRWETQKPSPPLSISSKHSSFSLRAFSFLSLAAGIYTLYESSQLSYLLLAKTMPLPELHKAIIS